MSQIFIPKGWKLKKLEEFCKINPPKSEIRDLEDETLVSFIPMRYVDDERGIIAQQDDKKLGEVRKGYTYFRNGDVIFAKITPCMENGKAAIGRELTNGIGFASTEFHVLRPNHEAIPEWIHYFVRNISFRNEAKTHFTGSAGQQRVPIDFLKSYEIPLPNIETQKKIIQKLDHILGQLEEKKKTILELQNKKIKNSKLLSNEFMSDLIAKLIPVGNYPRDWMPITLGSIFNPINQKWQPNSESKMVNYVALENIESNTGRLINFVQTDSQTIKSSKTIFKKNHVLYGKLRPYLNKVFLPDFDGMCSTDILVLEPNSNTVKEFLAYFLRSKHVLSLTSKLMYGTKMPRINTRDLSDIKLGLPSKNEQCRIVKNLQKSEDHINSIKQSIGLIVNIQTKIQTYLDHVQTSILNKAFSGKLVN